MDFGDNRNLDTKTLRELVYYSFKDHVAKISEASGVKFSAIGYSDLKINNDGRYTLSGQIIFGGIERGINAMVIGFAPGDGTGSPTKYDAKQKKGVGEIFIPIGTLFNDYFIPQLTCLTQIDGQGKEEQLGCNYAWYNMEIKHLAQEGLPAKIETFPLNLTYIKNEFGNPHAIKFDKWDADNMSENYKNWIQFGAFIEFKKPSNQLNALRKFSGEQLPWISHYNKESR